VAAPITKMDAVRRALDELGLTAPTAALREFVKMRFGLDMTSGHVKTYKGKILRMARMGGKTGATKSAPQKVAARTVGIKKATPAKPQAKTSPAPVPKGSGKGAGIPLDDILYVKKLVGRFGPGQLHTLIDAFVG
jgi:hypothetical protein